MVNATDDGQKTPEQVTKKWRNMASGALQHAASNRVEEGRTGINRKRL